MRAGSMLWERAALGSILIGLPALFIVFVLRPNFRAMNAMKTELESTRAKLESLPAAAPLGEDERKVLENPDDRWRGRIPSLRGDSERLAHYSRVVTELQTGLRKQGLQPCGIRSSWDPVRASFSLPGHLDIAASKPPSSLHKGPDRPQAWVIEVRLEGPAADLFKALRVLPDLGPLLEPVGLRWERGSEISQQSLVLRNYVLGP